MVGKVLNIARRITDRRRTRQGRIALAVWMAVKFAYGNSTKYGISKDEIKSFLHCGDRTVKNVIRIVWSETELFYVNQKKNCLFAKSCKSKDYKATSRKDHLTQRGDDVMTVLRPDCYENGQTESLKNLIELLDYLLIAKEYDKQAEYKSSGRGGNRNGVWGTEVQKSQAFTAKKVGLNRTTYYRRVQKMEVLGYVTKSASQIERSTPLNSSAFEAINKKTRLPYWLVSVPVTLELTKKCPFMFRYIIWDHKKRTASKIVNRKKSERYLDGMMTGVERVEFYLAHFHD